MQHNRPPYTFPIPSSLQITNCFSFTFASLPNSVGKFNWAIILQKSPTNLDFKRQTNSVTRFVLLLANVNEKCFAIESKVFRIDPIVYRVTILFHLLRVSLRPKQKTIMLIIYDPNVIFQQNITRHGRPCGQGRLSVSGNEILVKPRQGLLICQCNDDKWLQEIKIRQVKLKRRTALYNGITSVFLFGGLDCLRE